LAGGDERVIGKKEMRQELIFIVSRFGSGVYSLKFLKYLKSMYFGEILFR
jgi:hypothetical protein